MLDVEEPATPVRVIVERGGRGHRKGLALLAAALVLIGGGLVLTSGGGDAPAPEEDELARTSSTTTDPIVSTTAFVGEAGGPVFGARVDALVLLGGPDANWRLLDPDTGALREVTELKGLGSAEIVPVRGGVLITTNGVVVREGADGAEVRAPIEGLAFVALPSGEVHPVELPDLDELLLVLDVIPSGDPDRVWVLYGSGVGLRAAFIRVDGRTVSAGFDVPGSVRGATTRGLAVSAGGDAFLVAGDNDVSRLGDGDVVAATADEVALLTCDTEIVCTVSVVNLSSGRARRGPVVEGSADGSSFVSLSPGGSLVTLPQRVGSSLHLIDGTGVSVTLSLTDSSGQTTSIYLPAVRSEPVWLPDDLGLLVIANGAVMRVYEASGSLTAEPIRSLRPGLDDTLIVVPR